MSDQMALLPTPVVPEWPTDRTSLRADASARRDGAWDLDDRTREAGRRGLAAARRALAQGPSRVAA